MVEDGHCSNIIPGYMMDQIADSENTYLYKSFFSNKSPAVSDEYFKG